MLTKIPAILLALLLCSSSAIADEWSAPSTISQIEPHTEYQNGSLRIHSNATTNPKLCSKPYVYDFLFDTGANETRAAVVSGLYMAFTSGKQVAFYIDSDTCSPADSPIVRGIKIIY